jgi:hypothetical protein
MVRTSGIGFDRIPARSHVGAAFSTGSAGEPRRNIRQTNIIGTIGRHRVNISTPASDANELRQSVVLRTSPVS